MLDFQEQLKKQLIFLQNSSKLYDEGYEVEAIRIALIIRILVHQTASSTSLLSHLNANSIKLYNSLNHRYESINSNYAGMGVASYELGNEYKLSYKPKLKLKTEMDLVTIEDWWNQIVFIIQKPRLQGYIELTRKQIVLYASNKDGGAHVDSRFPIYYERLLTKGIIGSMGIEAQGKITAYEIDNIHLTALRQMAHELLSSEELLNLM